MVTPTVGPPSETAAVRGPERAGCGGTSGATPESASGATTRAPRRLSQTALIGLAMPVTDGQVLTADSTQTDGIKWATPASSSFSRATVTQTTASLANTAVENSTVTLAKTGHLLYLIADRACRVVLYATAAARTADAGRGIGTPPTPGTGVLCEFVFPSAETIYTGQMIDYYNGDGSPSSSIYYAITNLSGATHTVQVQFVHLGLES